jgi:hypothetical protein
VTEEKAPRYLVGWRSAKKCTSLGAHSGERWINFAMQMSVILECDIKFGYTQLWLGGSAAE